MILLNTAHVPGNPLLHAGKIVIIANLGWSQTTLIFTVVIKIIVVLLSNWVQNFPCYWLLLFLCKKVDLFGFDYAIIRWCITVFKSEVIQENPPH